MERNYYGIKISSKPTAEHWRWEVSLPTGGILTSNREYLHPELAIAEAERWLISEMAFSAINVCMAELQGFGVLSHTEYRNLMQSVLAITGHRHQGHH